MNFTSMENEEDKINEQSLLNDHDDDNPSSTNKEDNSSSKDNNKKIKENDNKQIQQLQEERNKLKEDVEKSIKTAAHFQNMYKEGQSKNIKDLELQKNRLINDFCQDALKFIDMFELSLRSINGNGDNKNVIDGIKMIYNYMIQTFENSYQLKKINCKIGDDFNYNIHDAQQEINTEDESQDGKIAEIITQGYMINNIILRNPVVKVFSFKK